MFLAGWNRQEIQIEPQGYAMFGYGMWQHRALQKRTALYARSVVLQDQQQNRLMFCCVDLGCITHAMRAAVIAELTLRLGSSFCEEALVLTATHTHSGPGGCGHEALYNMPTPGFVPGHLAAITDAVVKSLIQAIAEQEETEICISTAGFSEQTPVAWNRSIKAYNRNPDVQYRSEEQTHLAMNREMQLIGCYRNGRLHAFISFFGVHATCLGNSLNAHDGDNKGYAAYFSEQTLEEQEIENPVAVFAQAMAGDISPHFHGPGQQKIRNAIQGEQEYQYAQQNGRYQSELALTALQQKGTVLEGELDVICAYTDMSQVEIAAEFSAGVQHARTSIACHGAAFAQGTPVDGHGAAKPVIALMKFMANQFRKQKLKHTEAKDYAFYKALFDSQGPKHIFMESGSKKILGQPIGIAPGFLDPVVAEINRQVKAGAIDSSPLVPSVMPLQLVRIGQLCLVCCPGEITTTAGNRLVKTIREQCRENENIWLVSYCNDYMGYITTLEEYQEQAYEGGHTLFGQWTHAAFQTRFQQLAAQFARPQRERVYDRVIRPPVIAQHELDKRTNRGSLKTAVHFEK